MSSRTPALATAVNVLKGSLVRVLGFRTGRSTLGVSFSEGNKGRLTVVTGSAVAPTDSQMRAVEESCNEAISRSLPVFVFVVPREEAEEKYGDCMYDKAEVLNMIVGGGSY